MKNILLLLICVSTMYHSTAQQAPSTKTLTKEEYLQKSKKFWRVAIIVVSVGAATAIAGIIVGNKKSEYDGYEHGNASGALFITGCAVMLSSLCFSIPGHINKKKAMSLSFKNELSPLLQQGMLVNGFVPSLSLKINLRNP